MGEEVCFGKAIYGVKPCVYTNITLIMQILYLISIGQRHVRLHLMVWWPWLLPVSCFAARFCHCTSLVVDVEGHHQTCLPLQESLTACCMVMTTCMPVFKGVLLHFLSSIVPEHLLWPIFHVALSLSVCEPAMTHPSHWPTLLCLDWFTLVDFSMKQVYVEYWSYQLDVNAVYLRFTRHDLMMNSSFSL